MKFIMSIIEKRINKNKLIQIQKEQIKEKKIG